MGWFTGSVLFVLIWWTALFAVLPFVARPTADPDPISGVRGAQGAPFFVRTIVLTTMVSGLIWLSLLLMLESGLLSFRHGWLAVHGRCATDVRFCS